MEGQKIKLRLNTFQRLMRQWTELAPYNAGTLLHIAGAADLARWQGSAQQLIDEIGLGAPVFVEPDLVQFEPPRSVVVDQFSDLIEKTRRELNRPFLAGELPIRFFVCPGENETHWFGIIFDHWLTDGGTIAEMVVRLVVRYAQPTAGLGFPPHRLFDGRWEDLFAGKIPPTDPVSSLREAARVRSEHREVNPLGATWATNFETHFLQKKWPIGLWESIKRRAQQWGGSGHDLILAVLAQELSREGEEISLASVIDIRAEAEQPVAGLLSQFVSFYTNVIGEIQAVSLAELVVTIAEKNRRAKKEGRALRNLGALESARLGWERAATPEEKAGQFHQLAPLVAGVSHMNVTRLHREIGRSLRTTMGQEISYNEASPLLDATVVSPTGPLTPLLITINKLRPESVMMGCSYRTGAYSDAAAADLIEKFLRRLQEVSAV